MLSPKGKSDPSSAKNVTVMCEDIAGGKNVDPCQQPTFGPLLARLKCELLSKIKGFVFPNLCFSSW